MTLRLNNAGVNDADFSATDIQTLLAQLTFNFCQQRCLQCDDLRMIAKALEAAVIRIHEETGLTIKEIKQIMASGDANHSDLT